MQVLVAAVVQLPRRALGVLLHERLHDAAFEELAPRLGDAPVDAADEAAGLGDGKYVLLAVKGVEERVQTGGDVPAAGEGGEVEGGVQGARRRLRVDAFKFF